MLTPDQIQALRDAALQLTDPLTDYLLRDIARRISQAGQLTSTAAYQIWRTQQLGLSRREITEKLKALLKTSNAGIKRLLTQSAEVGYRFDLDRLPHASGAPFSGNTVLQQTVSAAVRTAQADFTNLTQTLGMVDPYGNVMPLQSAYRSITDYAFQQVFTGSADYNTAIRGATKNLAKYGLRTIDYESGRHESIEAATRRNIMSGAGLIAEQVSQFSHDELGADGWEISAHAASAPDHEPIQGKQYSDAEYKALNEGLVRRIGTLNCGHTASPIVLGVSKPQYTPEDLARMKEENAKGIDYQGRHYSLYEATQKQRDMESRIRTTKRRILVDDAAGDADQLLTDRIRLARLKDEYKRFSKAAGLRTQQERTQVAGFGRSQAAKASWAAKKADDPADFPKDTFARNLKANKITDEQYRRALEKRFLSGTENGKKVFAKYVPPDSVTDGAHTGVAHYSPATKKISMNYAADSQNTRGAGATFFHEHGHLVDFAGGKSVAAQSKSFKSALKSDFDHYIMSYMKKNAIGDRRAAFSAISADLCSSDKLSSVSDIMGGMSGNAIQGKWGHRTAYWSRDPDNVAMESFAHLFEAQFSEERLKVFSEYFPTATAEFDILLGGLI